MSHTPFFRLAFNLEIPRPSPTAIPHANDEEYNANNTDNTMATATGTDDNEQRGVLLLPKNKDKHFLRSVREHPRFSLRVTAIFVLIIGLVLNAIVTDNFWDWRIRHVIEPATPTVRKYVSDRLIFFGWLLHFLQRSAPYPKTYPVLTSLNKMSSELTQPSSSQSSSSGNSQTSSSSASSSTKSQIGSLALWRPWVLWSS